MKLYKEEIEQLANKKWYHGNLLSEKEMRIRPLSPNCIFWVTTSKEYAKQYSEKFGESKGGSVYEIFLKNGINVFNPKSKTDVKKLKWPVYFLWLLFQFDDLIDACDESLPENVYDKLYKNKAETPMRTKSNVLRYVNLAKKTRISTEQAKKLVKTWDEFLENSLQLSSFTPDSKKGVNNIENIPAGYVRMKLCEELQRLGYMGIFSSEMDFFDPKQRRAETLGIFSVDAIDKLTAKPIN